MSLSDYYPLDLAVTSDDILNIVLLQAKPGKVREVLNVSKKGYQGIGRYDVIFLEERRDYSLIQDIRKSDLGEVSNLDVISAFKWCIEGSTKKLSLDGAIVGICLIKFDVIKIKDRLLEHEQEMVKNIYDIELNNTNICVYGGLGWNELIAIIECNSLKDLSKAVNEIKINMNELIDITTIPSIKADYMTGDTLDCLKEIIDANVLISFCGGYTPNDILRRSKELFNAEGNFIFGYHDFIIDYNGELGGLLKSIDLLRREYSDVINETYILTSHNSMKFDVSETSTIPMISNRIKKDFVDNLDSDSNDLLFYYNLYETSLKDKRINDIQINQIYLYVKLINFLSELKYYRENDVDKYRVNKRILHSTIDSLRMSYMQRFSGVQISNLLNGRSINLGDKGISQRIIKSVEPITEYLLSLFSIDWSGFCLFSFYGIFYRLPFGILGYPTICMSEIEKFWGGFHETGHEVFDCLLKEGRFPVEVNNARNNRIEKARESAIKNGQDADWVEKTGIDRAIDEMVQEIFSDMFDFRFGFWSNWGRYIDTVWVYITNNFPINVQYLTRILILYLWMGDGKHHTKDDMAEYMDSIRSDLEQKAHKKIDDRVFIDAKNNVRVFDTISGEIARSLSQIPSQSLSEEKLKRVRSIFETGVPIGNLSPIASINALLCKPLNMHDNKTRFAAMLSIYWWYRTMLNEESIRELNDNYEAR